MAHRRQGPVQTSKFDESTGQVYTERTAPIETSDHRNWTQWRNHPSFTQSVGTCSDVTKCQELSNDAETSKVCDRRGARTLQGMALRYIARNIPSFTRESIEDLPLHLIRQVWNAIKESNTVTFDTWSTFSKILRRNTPDPALFQFNCIFKKTMPTGLHVYTTPLASNQFETLTSLSITDCFRIPELVKLSNLRNLVVLQIVNTYHLSITCENYESLVSDRLIREWGLAALNDGAFQVLRFLRLWDFKNVTYKSVKLLDAFPALLIYDIDGCGIVGQVLEPSVENKWVKSRFHFDVELSRVCPILPPPRQDKLSFIPREEIPVFLSQAETSYSSRSYEAWNKDFRVLDCGTWEDITSKAVSMLGHVQNDADLAKAGYDIGDQAVIEDALVNSIPIASLHLGSALVRPGMRERPMAHFTGFMRIFPESKREEIYGKEHAERIARYHAKRKQEGQEGRDVIQTKKRRLDDMLDSLL